MERDFIVDTVTARTPEATVDTIENFSTGYHSRNGGGDHIQTDGHLPVIDLRSVAAPVGRRPQHTDSRDRRPAQTVFGATVAGLRGLLYLVSAVGLMVSPTYRHHFTGDPSAGGVGDDTASVVTAAVVLLVSAAVDLILGWSVLRGRNWARLWLMSVSGVSTILAFVAHAQGPHELTLAQLLPISGSILVLLALSSHSAREYAARRT